MINGQLYDWESMEIRMKDQTLIGCTEISYSDERNIECRYGKGTTPRGFGRHNYSARCSITLDRDEFELFRNSCASGKVYNEVFQVVCSYGNEGMEVITDSLPECMVIKMDSSGKQGEDNSGSVKLDLRLLKAIKWNGQQAV